MTHAEFAAAYRAGDVHVDVDVAAARRFVSARLLLPFVAIPVIGGGIALVLIGWLWSGIALGLAGIVVPRLIKRSAPHFVLTQALEDERFHADAVRSGVIHVRPAQATPGVESPR